MILGRMDLRMGASKAKFDSGSDFEVKSAVDPRKPHEKPIYQSEFFFRKKFFFENFFRQFFFDFFDWESFEMRFGEVSRVKNREKTAKNVEKTSNFIDPSLIMR